MVLDQAAGARWVTRWHASHNLVCFAERDVRKASRDPYMTNFSERVTVASFQQTMVALRRELGKFIHGSCILPLGFVSLLRRRVCCSCCNHGSTGVCPQHTHPQALPSRCSCKSHPTRPGSLGLVGLSGGAYHWALDGLLSMQMGMERAPCTVGANACVLWLCLSSGTLQMALGFAWLLGQADEQGFKWHAQ